MKSEKILVGIVFVFVILLMVFASAQFSKSFSQTLNPGVSSSFLRSQGISVFPVFDDNMCGAGQDFLIQIAPFGCEPSVVRSDLLEEQNVPVFCQLSATQFNPLIDVKAIDSISFKGQYPKEVSGIGFYPASAAVRSSNKALLNSPILENIGYAIIVLKQQPIESEMPDFVEGNLTAFIRYDIENAFGIGKATQYLPELTGEEWSEKFQQYGFWNGKAYLRTEGIENDRAIISVYTDENNKVASFNLKKGQTSDDVYLPGLFCTAGLKLRLDGLENPDTRAKLNINGQVVEVGEGDKFLQNECRVTNLEKRGINQEVDIRCNTDNGFERFELRIAPKVSLTIDGVNDGKPKDYGMGDKLYPINDKKSVYIGYIGESSDGDKFIIPVVSPEFTSEAFKETLIYGQLHNVVKTAQFESGNVLANLITGILKSGGLSISTAINFLITGNYPVGWIYEEGSNKKTENADVIDKFFSLIGGVPFIDIILRNKIQFHGLAEPTDRNFGSSDEEKKQEEYYENAISDYRRIIDSFPSVKENQNSLRTFGEESLFNAIELAGKSQQKRTALEFCEEFKKRYPKSDRKSEVCDSLRLSSSGISEFGVVINGNTKIISLEGINEPTLDEYSAEIFIRGSDETIPLKKLRKNQIINFGDSSLFVVDKGFFATDLYFRYSNNWQWSPDRTNWMSVTTTIVSGGSFNKQQPTPGNRGLINSLRGENLGDGRTILLSDGAKEESSTQFIQLISLDEDSARIRSSFFSGEKKLTKDRIENFGSKYTFTLTKVNLKKVAKVTVLPNIQNAGTEANFTFKIGIEKRAIKLSPDEINDRIENLDKSIEKWEDTSKTLGVAVKGFNVACLATGTYLTAKNFLNNLDGESIARKEVMRGDGGYTDICKAELAKKDTQYNSLDDCFFENRDAINSDVKIVAGIIANQGAINDKNLCSELRTIIGDLGNGVTNGKTESNEKTLEISKDIETAFTKENDDGVCDQISLSQARDLKKLNSIISTSGISSGLEAAAESSRYNILSNIKANSENFADFTSIQGNLREANLNVGITSYAKKDSIVGKYSGGTVLGRDIIKEWEGKESDTNYPVEIITLGSKKYAAILQQSKGNDYVLLKAYEYKGINSNKKIIFGDEKTDEVDESFSKFREFNQASYKNKIINPEVTYFETAPYKGRPASVPFDLKNGWYAAAKQTLGSIGGSIRAYDDSGRVSSLWVCNVGENGKVEFNQGSLGIGDDECRQYNPGIGSIQGEFPGLEETESKKLVSRAISAIEEASRQYSSGVSNVLINGQRIKVGKPAVSVPDVQCQDLMSPEDCLLLFNTCDPVVCPSSRCNLGGNYYVADVAQSGIVGSTLLCLPNIKEGIVVPVCLTGIKAGIDSLTSVQKNYRDCLQENLDTGKTIGICDEIHSIYLCDFFWEQAAPLSQIAIPKIFEFIKGESSPRGGGEYAGVQSAWQNAQNSVDYMTQSYGVNSFSAFKARATESVGKFACRNFVSATYPTDIGFDSLIEPRSPPQYTAWFSESVFTTATVPATSQYKVFYHIFAGENNLQTQGAFYSVFLRDPQGTSFYQTNPTLTIASGFIAKGDFASETIDFTAPAGYQELCVRVNAQESCGYKKVTTDFALNYINDQYLKEQASQTNINSEVTCVSGTSSLYSLVNPNLQAGLGDVVNPNLYNQGIVRVCSSDNPGKGTDASAGTSQGRWQEVGTCDDGRGDIKCYLDTKSVKDQIKTISIEGETLELVSDSISEKLSEEREIIDKEIKEIEDEIDPKKKIARITNELIGKAYLNLQKAKLYLLRGDAYAELVEGLVAKIVVEKQKELSKSVQDVDDVPIAQEKWTIKTALEELELREGSYSENKRFIDGIYVDGLLTKEQYEDITGEGFFNFEEDMGYVRGILVGKLRIIIEGNVEVEDRRDRIYDFKTSRTKLEVIEIIDISKAETFVERKCECGEDCVSYAGFLIEAAKDEGIPDPLLLLSVMMQESSCIKDAPSGSSFGLMQINLVHCGNYGLLSDKKACEEELIQNPKKNIEVGAKILKEMYGKYNGGFTFKKAQAGEITSCNRDKDTIYDGWESALRGYVGWGCAQGHDNYVEEVMQRFDELNFAIINQISSDTVTGS